MNYSKIESKKQYQTYCSRHLELGKILGKDSGSELIENEYYILDLIIEDYHSSLSNPFGNKTPVDLLKALMAENDYSGYQLAKELGIAKSVIYDVLNYKRAFSKNLIRKLAEKFNVAEQSFLRDYELIGRESNVA